MISDSIFSNSSVQHTYALCHALEQYKCVIPPGIARREQGSPLAKVVDGLDDFLP